MALRRKKSILQDHVHLSSFYNVKSWIQKANCCQSKKAIMHILSWRMVIKRDRYNILYTHYSILRNFFFFYCYLFWSLLIIRVITWSWHTFANRHFSSKIFLWISMFYNDYSCIERFFSLIPIEPNAQRDRIIILCKRETRTKFAWIWKVSKISK